MPARKNAKKKAAPVATPLDQATQESINQSIANAEEKLIESDADAAIPILTQALQLDPSNAILLYLLAEAYSMIGDYSSALDHLQASCEADPDTNPQRYLSMAQFLAGEEALKALKKGIALIERDIQQIEQSGEQPVIASSSYTQIPSVEEMKHTLSSAYVAVVELYTTDCCDLPEAQSECERCIAQAITLRPDSLEAHQSQGNFRCILGEHDQAKVSLATCMDIIRNDPGLGSMSAMSLVDDSNEARDESDEEENSQFEEKTIDESDDDQSINAYLSEQITNQLADSPSYEIRLNVAKLAFELEKYEDALYILRRLSQEDDRIIEVQHLYACSLLLTNNVRKALRRAYIVLHMIEKSLSRDSSDEQSMDDAEDDTETLKISQRALQSVVSDCRKEIIADPSLVADEKTENPSLSIKQIVDKLCKLAKEVAQDPTSVASDEDDDDDWYEGDEDEDSMDEADHESEIEESDEERRMDADE